MIILRWEVPVDDSWHEVTLPSDAEIMKVGCQESDVVEFWTISTAEYTRIREFTVVGTGQDLLDSVIYIGTAERLDNGLVWHLIENN
jgi:hypothetical protein